MAAIHPTSLALLAVLGATALVIAIDLVLRGVRRRLDSRRWQTSDEVVIDLTFVHAAIRHDQEVARRIALGGEESEAGADDGSTGAPGAGRRDAVGAPHPAPRSEFARASAFRARS